MDLSIVSEVIQIIATAIIGIIGVFTGKKIANK